MMNLRTGTTGTLPNNRHNLDQGHGAVRLGGQPVTTGLAKGLKGKHLGQLQLASFLQGQMLTRHSVGLESITRKDASKPKMTISTTSIPCQMSSTGQTHLLPQK